MSVARKKLEEAVGKAFREGSPSTGTRRNITVIQSGWGSSGYYSPEVLERDIPRIFPAGTQMYLNHPTAKEEGERPERDLRDLVGKVVETPRMAGIDSVSVAQVYEHWVPTIDAIAGDIGLSIRAFGSVEEGSAGGKTGPIIQSLTEGLSIDYVTKAGAGGAVGELIESARDHTPSWEDQAVIAFNTILESAGKQAIPANLLKELFKESDDSELIKEALLIADLDLWKSNYFVEAEALYDEFLERDVSKDERIALAKKGQAIPIKDGQGNIIGGRFPMANCGDVKAAAMSVGRGKGDDVKGFITKVASKLSCPVPFKESGPGRNKPKETHVEIDEKTLAATVAEAVNAAMKKKDEEEDNEASKKKVTEAEQRAAKAEEGLRREKGAAIVARIVNEKEGIDPVAKGRIVESAMAGEIPTLTDGSLDERALEERANQAIRKEDEYLSKIIGKKESPKVEGAGSSFFESNRNGGGGGGSEPVEPTEDEVKSLEESFVRTGMSKEAAKAAAEGR